MHKKIKEATAKFNEIKTLIDQLHDIKIQERRLKRRLKTKLDLFEFLSEIVGLDMKHKKLTEPLFKYFKALGLNVHRPPHGDKLGKEDLRLFHGNKMLLIEATSIESNNAGEKKLTQILRHINGRQNEFSQYKVYGLTIVNYQDKIDFDKRNNIQEYTKDAINDLVSNSLTAVSTVKLLNDFIMIKSGQMSIDELINNLTSFGVYK